MTNARATIPFVKMSGAGNDFVVLDEDVASRIGADLADWVRAVCRRGLSVGADGVLVVGAASPGRVRVRFLNPDGTEAFCGNGSRCAARHATRRGWASAAIVLETLAGDVAATVVGRGVRLLLPVPEDLGSFPVDLDGKEHPARLIRAGVPHLVIPVERVGTVPLATFAPELRKDPRWGADGANVNVVSRRTDGAIEIRTWERGVEGETLSCGSGAVAAGFAVLRDERGRAATVVPRSGVALRVETVGPVERPEGIVLEGDARIVFEGRLDPEGLEGAKA